MHPWGKWGRNFVEYGVHAIGAALADAELDWRDVEFVAGADTIRNGYPGYVAGATFAQAMGWTGIPVTSCYAACASGATAMDIARTRILAGLCDVALVVGADTTPKGFFAPTGGGDRQQDPDWLRFRLLGATNPTYFGLYARRRMDLLRRDRGGLRPGQGEERPARPGQPQRPVPQGGHRSRRCWRRPSWPSRCGCSRSAPPATAARRSCSRRWTTPAAMALDPVRVAGISLVTPTFPNTVIEMPNFATDSAAGIAPGRSGRSATPSPTPPTSRPASAPTTSTSPRCTTCPRRSSSTGTRTSGSARRARPSELLHDGDTALGGRVPVNPSGGLSCFGEAIPAQAIAQVCELTWQLRGQAGTARSRAPASASPPTRASSATAPASCACASPAGTPSTGPALDRVMATTRIDRASADDVMALATDVGPAPMQVGACIVVEGGAGLEVDRIRALVGDRIRSVPASASAWPPHRRVAGDRCG